MDFDSAFEYSVHNWNHNEPQSWLEEEHWEEILEERKMQKSATAMTDWAETDLPC